MYGNGVGSLRVWFRPNGDAATDGPAGGSNRILWEMSGDSGNNWYIAQLPIASAVSFQIAFEAVVGLNYLGNIAIDSISLEQGSCPSKYFITFDHFLLKLNPQTVKHEPSTNKLLSLVFLLL